VIKFLLLERFINEERQLVIPDLLVLRIYLGIHYIDDIIDIYSGTKSYKLLHNCVLDQICEISLSIVLSDFFSDLCDALCARYLSFARTRHCLLNYKWMAYF